MSKDLVAKAAGDSGDEPDCPFRRSAMKYFATAPQAFTKLCGVLRDMKDMQGLVPVEVRHVRNIRSIARASCRLRPPAMTRARQTVEAPR